MSDFSLEERFPLINNEGRRMIRFLQEHPQAPPFTDSCGDFLNGEGLQRVAAFARSLTAKGVGWLPGQPPDWLPGFIRECFEKVPHYRNYDLFPETPLTHIPTINRGDLERGAWHFVPDDLDVNDILVYRTSGTTGHPIETLWHPMICAMYLPLIQTALRWRGTAMGSGPDRVAQVMVCFQQRTVTCPCVSAYLDQAGFVKVNLHPGAWHHPEDPAAYLNACNPDTYSGDPISFAALLGLPLTTRPLALVSTAMALSPGFHRKLEAHFESPVIDLYSLTESGPVAAGVPGRLRLLPHQLFVEILDPAGQPLPPGQRGEITLTGGFNPYLPLLRYRTGDWAALSFEGRQPYLIGLEGRPPVLFLSRTGALINNIDVTHALRPFGLAQFTLHQNQDRSLEFTFAGVDLEPARLRQSLQTLFGPGQPIAMAHRPIPAPPSGKIVQYTSDMNLFADLAKQ
jgi:phenylacetate-CoA ligase